MFHNPFDYPLAVTSSDGDGLLAGIKWCTDQRAPEDHITVWTHGLQNLEANPLLKQFVHSSSQVHHITSRGLATVSHTGPVLMAWAEPTDIAEVATWRRNQIRALCVVAWNEDALRPWVSSAQPHLLGATSKWNDLPPALDPVVEAAMASVTRGINHNNTIHAGVEKDAVVSTLLALHDAGFALDGTALAGWAVAHGWASKNPAHLKDYVSAINRGSRPRIRQPVPDGYIDSLRAQVSGPLEEG